MKPVGDKKLITKREGEAMMRFKPALVFAAVLLIVFCWTAMAQEQRSSRNSSPDQPGEEDILNRELWRFAKGTPYEVAERHIEEMRKTEPAPTAEVVLPTGWKIAPAGGRQSQVEVGRLPEEAVFYNEHIVVLNTGYYWKGMEPQEISIVDPASREVKKVLHPGSLFPCAVAGLDGDLYISGGYDQVVYRYNNKFELVRKYSVQGYAAGLAPIDQDHDHLAVVYLGVGSDPKCEKSGHYGKGKLAILNTKTGKIELEKVAGYFPHTVRYLNKKLYVTILGEDKLNVYDSQAHLLKSLPVGKTPQDICPDPQANRLYVVNTGSDTLSVVDAGKDEVVSEIPVRSHGEGFGCGPTSCAVDGDRLFVTLAYKNAVGIFDKREGKRLGFIPTGWYPTKVIPRKEWVAVLSAKGIRARRPNVNGPQPNRERCLEDEYVLTLLKGTLGIIAGDQIEANLHAWTRQVEEGSPIYGFRKGIMPPIHHVFFIVRENRTYDQVLGDLGRGNGDPELTLFGDTITPNAHELARQFVTLDNYFADGEISVLGHSYTTSGYASPFMELMGNMSYSGRYVANNYPFGCVPALSSPKYLWDVLEKKNIDYRIYGENYFLYTRAQRIIKESFEPDRDRAKFYDKFYAQMMVLAAKVDRGEALYSHAALFQPQPDSVDKAKELLKNEKVALLISQYLLGDDSLVYQFGTNEKLRDEFAKYLYHYPINYPSWDLKVSDLERVKVWKADFENQVNNHSVAQFHYIWLPNDHTAGTDLHSLTPFQFVAQNDAALGIIIDTISKHDIWKESLILVTEDDAQNGPDHVDATRTVALAAGPYVKRGAVVNDRYDQLSMLRTIEVLLGLDPQPKRCHGGSDVQHL
jgi:YVTN family beta-propeller protein